MGNCATFGEQLLDFLYGLLDEEESARLQLHLQACPHCQAQLHEAEGHQRLIAQAALACTEVAPFAPPEQQDVLVSEPVIVPLPQATVAAAGPAASRLPRSRFPRWVRYGSVALAASLLVGIVIAREAYRSGLKARQDALAQVRNQIDTIDAKYQQASSKFQDDKKQVEKPAELVQLTLTGPSQFDRNAGAVYTVAANNLNGSPQKAPLDVRLVDAASKKVLFQEQVFCQGENTTVTLPPVQAAGEMQLTVTELASPPLACTIRTSEPVFVTHLALNKLSFYQHELLFFRTVTLEQFSLKPIAREIDLRFSLIDAQGRTVRQVLARSGPGGISGGELALSGDIPTGNYILEAAAVANDRILPQRRRVEILSAGSPQVVMEKSVYAPGEWAKGTLVAANAMPITDQRIEPGIVQPGSPAPAPAIPRTYTDNEGNFQVPIPYIDASKAMINLRIPSRTSSDSVRTTIGIVPSRVLVDLFPEGGDLVHGVPTRIYYRVRSLQGDPVVPDGQMILTTKSGKVLFQSEAGRDAGVFPLTPFSDEHYEVRLTSERMKVVNENPFANLPIQKEGLILSVPQGVAAAGSPIEVRIAARGESKRLLVLATCRGQIVDQQNILVREGNTKIDLRPIAEAAGILRVTVYESRNQTLIPLAERLVYRKPVHRLELLGNPVLQAGKNSLKATWCDEAKRPVDCYLLAAVVDSQYAAGQGNDLVSHFYLGNDLASPADLENAMLLVRDTAESWRALDLFLGTHGWRRFVAAAALGREMLAKDGVAAKELAKDKLNEARLTQQHEAEAVARLESENAPGSFVVPPLVNLQNAALADLRNTDLARKNVNLARLSDLFAMETADLARARSSLVDPYRQLAQNQFDYEQIPSRILRAVLGLVLFGCLGIGAVLMLAGFIRMARGRLAAPVFAASFASLGLCLALMFALRPGELHNEVCDANLELPGWPAQVAQIQRLPAPPQAKAGQQKLPLVVASAGPDLANKRDKAAVLRDGLAADELARKQLLAQLDSPQNDLARSLSLRNTDQQVAAKANTMPAYGGNVTPTGQGGRFEKALARQQKPSALPAPLPSRGGGTGGLPGGISEKKADAVERAREYAFALNSTDRCDQMLWQPATILWAPAILARDGQVLLNFELPNPPQSNYQVIIQAHTLDGRLGSYEKTLAPAR